VLWSLVVVVAVSPGILAAILPLSLSYYFIQVSCGAGVMAVQGSLRNQRYFAISQPILLECM
jgi:uncharacterized membrane protein